MLVSERFTIDEDTLGEKAEKSDYWKNVKKFWFESQEKECETLTERQLGWLEKIELDLAKESGEIIIK